MSASATSFQADATTETHAVAGHTLLGSAGAVVGWGSNAYGQLGEDVRESGVGAGSQLGGTLAPTLIALGTADFATAATAAAITAQAAEVSGGAIAATLIYRRGSALGPWRVSRSMPLRCRASTYFTSRLSKELARTGHCWLQQ